MKADTMLQDRIRGSIVGGAIGDALGYTVEFIFSAGEIRARYGETGITDYDTRLARSEGAGDIALFSDDTQMTLYTAEGIVEAVRSGSPIVDTIRQAYLVWYGGQMGKRIKISYDSPLSRIDALNQRRAPGNTCLSALEAISRGKQPWNDSKGCGGIMRVAPVGLYGAAHGWPLAETARVAGEAARLTHLHPLSTYPSAALAVIVQLCACAEAHVDREAFTGIVNQAVATVSDLYGAQARSMEKFKAVVSNALSLVNSPLADSEIIEKSLGGGWVAEETLAIALFSVLRHIDDFAACMVCAVNHCGDSDSTGAVAGNILGAILGYSALPARYTDRLQLLPLLLDTADTLL